jgi:hypothetical protein
VEEEVDPARPAELDELFVNGGIHATEARVGGQQAMDFTSFGLDRGAGWGRSAGHECAEPNPKL